MVLEMSEGKNATESRGRYENRSLESKNQINEVYLKPGALIRGSTPIQSKGGQIQTIKQEDHSYKLIDMETKFQKFQEETQILANKTSKDTMHLQAQLSQLNQTISSLVQSRDPNKLNNSVLNRPVFRQSSFNNQHHQHHKAHDISMNKPQVVPYRLIDSPEIRIIPQHSPPRPELRPTITDQNHYPQVIKFEGRNSNFR